MELKFCKQPSRVQNDQFSGNENNGYLEAKLAKTQNMKVVQNNFSLRATRPVFENKAPKAFIFEETRAWPVPRL